jgi:hypothetical protein
MGMGTVTKRSVSIDSEVYDGVAQEARESHMSVSAALSEGAQLWLVQRRGLRAVELWEADHGALSSTELQEADRALDSALAAQE